MKKVSLDGFTIDQHSLEDHDLFVTYQAKQDGTGHYFSVDFIKKKITSEGAKEQFQNTCENLRQCCFHPLFNHFFDGVLSDDGQGVLIWRQVKDLVPLRRLITDGHEMLTNQTSALRLFAKIALAFRLVPELEMTGHGDLTIDNVLIDVHLETPVLARHGLRELWLTLYGDKGKLPPLICPPEYASLESQVQACQGRDSMENIDSFAFGSLLYQTLAKHVLDPNKPFDRSLLEANLSGGENLFLREIIASCVAPEKAERPSAPFASHTATFNTLLQKQVNPVKLKTFCVACAGNGDADADVFAKERCAKIEKPPFLHGVKQGQMKFRKPVPVSFIIGRKVIHNPEAFAKALESVEPGKKIIFINVFGGYQKGKSTTLYLLSGNGNYVLGSGTYETTRGVCVDGPYRLSDLDSVFRNVPGFNDTELEMAYDEEVLKDNPYIFLIDIEGYDGSINGFDEELNKRLYEQLAKPYLSLSSTVLLLSDKSEGLAARNFAAQNLKLQKFSNTDDMNMINLMVVIRNVDKYSAMGSVFPYSDPWKKDQFKGACVQFRNQFGKSFERDQKTVIHVEFYPLALWDDRGTASQGVVPKFDKSFIVMARGLLSTIYKMRSSTHCTDRVGALRMFEDLSKMCNPLRPSTSEDDIKEAQAIAEKQKAAYKTYLTETFKRVKGQVLDTMIKDVEAVFKYFEEHVNTFTAAQLDEKRNVWTKRARELFESIVKEQEKMAVDSDSFGLLDAEMYSTIQELEKFVSQRQLVFTKEVLKKHCDTFKFKLMKILPQISDQLVKNIEHDLLSEGGWDYYVKNYKDIEKFANDNFAKSLQGDGILTSAEMKDMFSATVPEEIRKWRVEYIDGVKRSFVQRVKAAFEYARVTLAKSKSPKITQKGPDRKIKGQKGFVERTIVQEWKAPDGTSVIEQRDICFPSSKQCLLI